MSLLHPLHLLHPLTWIFFLCLHDGESSVEDQTPVYGGVGSNLSIPFKFDSFGLWKILCRNNCSRENILIETKRDSAENGRYSLLSERRGIYGFRWTSISVLFSQLSSSDSGLYLCGLGNGGSYTFRHFQVLLVDAVLEEDSSQQVLVEAGRSLTVACSFKSSGNSKFFSRNPFYREQIMVQMNGNTHQEGRYSIKYEEDSASGVIVSVSIKHLEKSDSGWYRCGMTALPFDKYIQFLVVVRDASAVSTPPSSTSPNPELTTESGPSQNQQTDVLLPAGLALGAVLALLSLALLFFCIKRDSKHEGRSVETGEEASGTEDAADGRPPGDIRSRHARVVFNKPRPTDGEDDYNVVMATRLLHRGEDAAAGLTYSEVVFHQTDPPHGAPHGKSPDVVYSSTRDALNSGDDLLYSNVSQHRGLEDFT